jgi:formate dehydrogenase
LHPETEHLFNDALIGKMKRGAYLVNTARGKICDRDAVARALDSGQLAGYAGDVWFPQPAPKDHLWRTMPHHGMTPHISGSSLSAQARSAAGTREILECWFERRPIREEYLIVDGGKLAGAGAHSYSVGKHAYGLKKLETLPRGIVAEASRSDENHWPPRRRRYPIRQTTTPVPVEGGWRMAHSQ